MTTTRRGLGLLLAVGLGLGAVSCGSGDDTPDAQSSAGADGPVTITVGCQPPKSNPKERAAWDADVAEFQKLHPNITIQSKDAFPCINPDTFQAKLAGGTQEDVFYVYYTDVQKIIKARQAADISEYVGSVKAAGDLRDDVLGVFKDGDKTYGLPRNNYNMGLVYNRKLFSQAGLDPDAPPKTWSEVQAAAKKIAGLGAGYVGFGEYSAGNTGGWHFAASLYARGGSMVSDDGKTAAFNSAEGKAVLENLKQMRWNDNSMGSKQLLQWEDLMRMMGSGKLGMMIGAPDVVQSVNNDFQGKFEDYGVAAVPESEGKASLSGGDGYMFNPKATPEKIKAGLLWLEFHELTPGKGQFNYQRSKEQGRPVGLPIPDLYGDSAPGKEIVALRKQYATVPVDHFAPYVAAQSTITNKLEPPKAQELYAVLDVAMSAVLTRQDADIDKLLSDAESKANPPLAQNPELTVTAEPVRRPHPVRTTDPQSPDDHGALRRAVGRNLTAYGFLCGALICFALFSWYPMVREVLLSFQENNFVDPPKWVGFDNFRAVIEDPAFRSAWINTAVFSGLALVIGYAVPFVLAVVLNELKHAKAYLRFVVYLPVMLPPAVAVLLFKWFYDPGSGLFNQVLDVFGIPPLSWLDSTSTALVSLVLVSTWMNLGTGTLIYLAALQSIPGDLYESAELDGAGLFRRVWHVTIPQTKLILLVMLLLQVVATMQVFIEPYLLTGGGPENATVTVAYLMYQYAFNFGDFGGGGALGLMLMVVLMVFSAIYLRVSREAER